MITRSASPKIEASSWETMTIVVPKIALDLPDQFVELARVHRIQAGPGLVEEDDGRIERQGARQAGALAHARR